MKIVTHLKVAGTLVNIHSYMISGSISLVNIHSLRGRSRLASITTAPVNVRSKLWRESRDLMASLRDRELQNSLQTRSSQSEPSCSSTPDLQHESKGLSQVSFSGLLSIILIIQTYT